METKIDPQAVFDAAHRWAMANFDVGRAAHDYNRDGRGEFWLPDDDVGLLRAANGALNDLRTRLGLPINTRDTIGSEGETL